jgi:hypothetical protein
MFVASVYAKRLLFVPASWVAYLKCRALGGNYVNPSPFNNWYYCWKR